MIAHATTVDNRGKVSILRRILAGLAAMGVGRVAIMPDSYHLGQQAVQGLGDRGASPDVTLLDMPVTNGAQDSEVAAGLLRQAGAAAIIVLGGDGTVRAVSKGAGEVPLVPISTGTNNVLPRFIEGTIAGLAAGALATGRIPLQCIAMRHKWLEVRVNGVSRDRALVDVVVLRGRFVGARAVWNMADVRRILVTRAHPSNIGMSAIAAAVHPIDPEEPRGLALTLHGEPLRRIWAAIGPGLIRRVDISAIQPLEIGEAIELAVEEPLIVALDGEREVLLHEGDRAQVVLRADGPWIVQVERVMEEMAARAMFDSA